MFPSNTKLSLSLAWSISFLMLFYFFFLPCWGSEVRERLSGNLPFSKVTSPHCIALDHTPRGQGTHNCIENLQKSWQIALSLQFFVSKKSHWAVQSPVDFNTPACHNFIYYYNTMPLFTIRYLSAVRCLLFLHAYYC